MICCNYTVVFMCKSGKVEELKSDRELQRRSGSDSLLVPARHVNTLYVWLEQTFYLFQNSDDPVELLQCERGCIVIIVKTAQERENGNKGAVRVLTLVNINPVHDVRIVY